MCRQAATRTPSSGRSAAKRSRIERRTGICPSAHSMRAAPAGAGLLWAPWLATSPAASHAAPSRTRKGRARREPAPFGRTKLRVGLVAVVVRLVRPVDRHVDVRGLVGRQLGELHAERPEVQAGDLLVEVLREHVDLLLVL